MIEPSSLLENILYCTTRIVGVGPRGNQTGTGFFFNFPTTVKDQVIPVVISNKHVIRNASRIMLRVHTAAPGTTRPEGNNDIAASESDWIQHPIDDVDLCALPVGGAFNSMQPPPFFRAIDPTILPSQDQLDALDAIEDVIMVGYPIGLSDEANNLPLIRRGITASHPAVDFDGKPITGLDMACFPGSSGSPVFIFNRGSYTDKRNNTMMGAGRIIFLGILFGAPVMHSDGKIVIKEVPTASVLVPSVDVMINLGYIVKSNQLMVLRDAVFRQLNVVIPG